MTKGREESPAISGLTYEELLSISMLVLNLVNIVLDECHQNYSHQIPVFHLKCTNSDFGRGSAPDPPTAGFGEGKRKKEEGKETGEKGWERKVKEEGSEGRGKDVPGP